MSHEPPRQPPPVPTATHDASAEPAYEPHDVALQHVPQPQAPQIVYVQMARLAVPPGSMACPACHHIGPPIMTARGGSCLVMGFLLLFFILPAVLYAVFLSGYRYQCQVCRFQLACDN